MTPRGSEVGRSLGPRHGWQPCRLGNPVFLDGRCSYGESRSRSSRNIQMHAIIWWIMHDSPIILRTWELVWFRGITMNWQLKFSLRHVLACPGGLMVIPPSDESHAIAACSSLVKRQSPPGVFHVVRTVISFFIIIVFSNHLGTGQYLYHEWKSHTRKQKVYSFSFSTVWAKGPSQAAVPYFHGMRVTDCVAVQVVQQARHNNEIHTHTHI